MDGHPEWMGTQRGKAHERGKALTRMYRIRQGKVEDADTIYRIWSEGVEASLGAKPTVTEDFREYFRSRLEAQNDVFKYFVVENEQGQILSWQSLSPFRSNPAVAGVMAELSAYASVAHAPPGRATLLGLEETMRFADQSPLHYVVAFIAENNPRALRLAEHIGLKRIGTFPRSPEAPSLPELAYLVYPCRNSREVKLAASLGEQSDGGQEPGFDQ